MTAQDMLDYAFGLLDGPTRESCERLMAADPVLAARVSRLGSSIANLVDDGEEIEPPAGLAERTVALVERRKQRPHLQDFVPSRIPFRWADLAVAALVFFAAMLTLTVPLMRSRAQMEEAACANNLGKLGVSLAKYTSTHGSYPFVPASYPVGSYGVMLHDTNALSDPTILSCPCAGKGKTKTHGPMPTYESFQKMVSDSPEACRELVDGHFAYNIGYHGPKGEALPVSERASGMLPIASDSPPCDGRGQIFDGNSPSHGGHGQNVLFSDGHVSWLHNRWLSAADKDIFLNAEGRPALGVRAGDSALVPSVMPVLDH